MASTVQSKDVRVVVRAMANVASVAKVYGNVVAMTDGMESIVLYRWNKIVMTTKTTTKVCTAFIQIHSITQMKMVN